MVLRPICFLLLITCSAAAQPQPLPEEPVDAAWVLQQTQIALETLPGAAYDFTLSATSTLHPPRLRSQGTVRIRRAADDLPGAWRVTTTDPDGTLLCDLAFDGTTVVGYDPSVDRAFIGDKSVARPLVELARPALMPALLDPGEFVALMGPDSIAIEGRSTIDGIECRIMRLNCRTPLLDLRLHLGIEDHLPHALERLSLQTSGITTGVLLELTHLNVASAPQPADLVVSLGGSIRHIALDADTTTAVPLPGTSAVDFTVTDAAGNLWNLNQWRNSVVVLNFHDPDNIACAASAQCLRALVEQYPQSPLRLINVRVLSNDASPDPADLPGLTVADPGPLADQFAVEAVPTVVIIDREGRIVRTFVGSAAETLDALTSTVTAALQPPVVRSADVPTDR